MNLNKIFLLFTCIHFLMFCSSKTVKPSAETIQEEIIARDKFESPEAITFNDTTNLDIELSFINDCRFMDSVLSDLRLFYQLYDYKTRWLYSDNSTPLFDSYMAVLNDAKYYGFDSETYALSTIKKEVKAIYSKEPHANSDIIELDKQITASFLLFTKHLVDGRVVDPSNGNKIWVNEKRKEDEVDFLLKLVDNESLDILMASLHPKSKAYHKLKDYLKKLYNSNEPDVIPFNIEKPKEFTLGYTDEKVKLLRYNLKVNGYNPIPDSLETTIDSSLIETIVQFQKDRTIDADGIPGKNTLKYLNMTRDEKIDIIILNMERMRWLNKDFGHEYVIVNIPSFNLFYFKNDSIILKSKVIVGKEYNSTPIFMDEIEYVEFRPTWTVPQSIIRKEFIPKLRSNPYYYTDKGFTISEKGQIIDPGSVNWSSSDVYSRYFTFVEKPSNKNSLGLVKFIFPNNMSVYLHDTPAHYLFSKNDRAFSHGCVRVEKPAELAYALLQGNKKPWTMDEVLEAMNTGDVPQRVHLDTHVLVQLVYITAYVDENNQLVVRNDIYGHDANQLNILYFNYNTPYCID